MFACGGDQERTGFAPPSTPCFARLPQATPARPWASLSGSLDDGTAGLIDLKRCGGLAMAQDPADASSPGMPRSAVRFASPDHVATADSLAGLVAAAVKRLAAAPASAPTTAYASELDHLLSRSEGVTVTDSEPEATGGTAGYREVASEVASDPASAHGQPGTVSALTCPECGGTLWEVAEGDFVRFHCRVGHAYGPESLDAAQLESLEQSLWPRSSRCRSVATFA